MHACVGANPVRVFLALALLSNVIAAVVIEPPAALHIAGSVRAPPATLSRSVRQARRATPLASCAICARDAASCPPGCPRAPLGTASERAPASADFGAGNTAGNCGLCKKDGRGCPGGCDRVFASAAPTPRGAQVWHGDKGSASPAAMELEPAIAPSLEPSVNCWVCELIGVQCPAECERARKRRLVTPSAAPSAAPSATPVASSKCAWCATAGAMCPDDCDARNRRQSEKKGRHRALDCKKCRAMGVPCPRSCSLHVAAKHTAGSSLSTTDVDLEKGTNCRECKFDGVECHPSCKNRNGGATNGRSQGAESKIAACVRCRRTSAVCPPHCTGPPRLRHSVSASLVADASARSGNFSASVAGCAHCGRDRAGCPYGCGASSRSPPAINCWECEVLGVQCDPGCIKPSPSTIEASLERNDTCWTCRLDGVGCPRSCRDSNGGSGPSERDANCWLCRALDEACSADCSFARQKMPRNWMYSMESSCWLCGAFPSLCPSVCGRGKLSRTVERQDIHFQPFDGRAFHASLAPFPSQRPREDG